MGLTPYDRAQSTTPEYFSNRNRKKNHIKNKKMIIYPVVGLFLVVVLVVGLGLGLEVEVGDVVLCVFVDHGYRRKHFDKCYIRHLDLHVQSCYGNGNH